MAKRIGLPNVPNTQLPQRAPRATPMVVQPSLTRITIAPPRPNVLAEVSSTCLVLFQALVRLSLVALGSVIAVASFRYGLDLLVWIFKHPL